MRSPMAIKDVPQDSLDRLRKCVETSYIYFKDNNQRFRDFKNYTFRETLNEQQKGMLTSLDRPQLEFNMGAANVARKLGEFAEHEPSIIISPSEGTPVGDDVIQTVEGNIRHKIHDANKDGFSNAIMKDQLGGGFSAAKVRTDFQSPMSFHQDIIWEKCFDSTLVGFDPLARAPHKGDGQYSFEMYPVIADDLKMQFPQVKLDQRADSTYIESFEWSYKDMHDQHVILVCDFYEKKKKRVKIVKLADGRTMTKKKYKEMQQLWIDENIIEQIPEVMAERMTVLDIICKYVFIRDQVLDYQETDYAYLPHVFFDGNSDILCKGHTNTTYQFTKPYYYHCKGAQDMMNFMGIAITNSIDNLSASKFIVMEEAIPQQKDYKEALTNPQRANTLVVRAYSENNPDKPIPNPIREVQYPALPPEVMGTFNQSITFIQAILGSGGSNPDNKQDYISGKAIIEAVNVDNAAGMPYIIGYLSGLEQMARIHTDLMPKYLLGKRTIPVVNKAGDKIYQDINVPGKPAINYEPGAIKVNIDAGVNFQVQKEKALQQIQLLSSSNPKLAEFFSSEEGLPILLDNLTIYGADRLKEAAENWMEMQKQQQQQMMQMQQEMMQNDPQYIRAQADIMKAQVSAQEQEFKARQAEFDNQIEIAKQAVAKILADAKLIESEAKVAQAQIDSAVRLEEAETSKLNHALDAAVKVADVNEKEHALQMKAHENHRENIRLHHEITKPKEQKE